MPAKIEIRSFLAQLGGIYRQHFFTLFLLTFVAYLLPNALSVFMQSNESIVLSLLGLALQVAAWIAVLVYACALLGKSQSSPVDALRQSASILPSVTGAVLLRLGAVALGTLALIIPGIVVYVLTVASGPAAVSGKGPWESFRYSITITKGNRWRIAAALALLLAGFLVLYLLIVFSVGSLMGGVSAEEASSPAFLVLPLLLITATVPLFALAEAIIFQRLALSK